MNQEQNTFLRSTVPAAQQTQRIYGVPASITLAQAVIESSNKNGWGQSALALRCNNYFGIKANIHAAPEAYAEFPTPEFIDGRKRTVLAKFARYPSPADCFQAHALLLSRASRYAPAMAVKDDPAKFAAALESCGYSTNPEYAETLMRLVNEYDLTQYDVPASAPQPAAPAVPAES